MRLIDADALMRCIPNEDITSRFAVENAPTIEAEPVRHGHWIFTNKPNIYGGTSIKCSECGYEGMVAHIEDHHYCWVCGAKMDEVNDGKD